MNSKDIESHC